jgi:hypothetical protein
MPLLDHFHPPLSTGHRWESFHALWAATLTFALNERVLPSGYFAEAQVHVGNRIEVDVATLEHLSTSPSPSSDGGTATLSAPVWAPPVPALVLPAVFPDELEVLVYNSEGGPTLVAAVELVSPGNKDRAEYRQAFAIKCASHLQQGVGVVVVDVVTSRQANLHDELVRLLGQAPAFTFPGGAPLYAVAYRPARRPAGDQIDVWPAPLTVGQTLPIMPLPLRGFGCVPLDLETSYTEARQRSRLG